MNRNEISVEATIAITERSRSTWWRRIAKGEVTRMADDPGGRTMLLWSEVAPLVCIPMGEEDIAMVLLADAGEASAQNDIGQYFSNAGKHDVAMYWIRKAVEQNHPDAMQWLGHCHLSGAGVARDDYLGIMWIAKAAAHGHAIAMEQMKWFKDQLAGPA